MNQDNAIRTWLNTFAFGLIAGSLVPLLSIVIFNLIAFPDAGLSESVKIIVSGRKLSALISISLVPDLLVFFIFIWLNYLYSARGVLAAVFLFALAVVLTKFLI